MIIQRVLCILILTLSVNAIAQAQKLKLPAQFDKLVFESTNVKSADKIFGEPDSVSSRATFAYTSIGCISTFTSERWYRNTGCELLFYSMNKDKMDKKVLSRIHFDSTSTIRINDSLQFNVSDSSVVMKLFGEPADKWRPGGGNTPIHWQYQLSWNGQKVFAQFIFDPKNIVRGMVIYRDNS